MVPDPSPYEARRGQARRHVRVRREPLSKCLCVGGGLAGESLAAPRKESTESA